MMRAWGRPDRHATIGGIRHAGPAPAPCGEGYASPLTRARGAWRTETPVVPRFLRGKGFRPLDNGCFLFCPFVCFPVCVLIVWLVSCLLVSVFWVVCFCFRSCVLLVLVVLSGLYCVCSFFCLSGLFCWFWSFCPACVSLLFRLVVSSCFPCCAVLSCFPFRPCLFPVFFFFGVPFLPPTAGAVRPACAPCGARAFPFPLVFPYRRPRARRRMMRMPWYSPRAKRRMARTASRRPCARPARVVPAGEAGRRAGRRVSSGSGVVSGV